MMCTKLNNLRSFGLEVLEALTFSRWSGMICLFVLLCLGSIVKAEEYNLYIAGTQVTSDNASDVLGNGKVSYNTSSNTLTISDNIRTYDENTPCIKSGIDYLIIKVDAMSELRAKTQVIYLDSKKTTITGFSLLTLYSEDTSVETIIQKNGNLVIDKANILVNNMVYFHTGNMSVTDATLTVGGRIWGWAGNLDITNSKVFVLGTTVSGGISSAGGTLSIDNSTVEAYFNDEEGAVWLWEDVKLTGCYLKTPQGGSYDKKDRKFKDAEGNVAPKVEIISEFTTKDGVRYNVTSPTTVEVIAPTEGRYSGAITIPATVTNDENTFQVTAIAPNAFQLSTVTSVSLPLTNLTSIGPFAFNDCRNLTEFTLPECITSIGEKAFYYCDNLKHLYVHSSDPDSYDAGNMAFSKIHYGSHECTLHVPAGTTEAYAADNSPFKAFTKVEEYAKYNLSVAGTLVTSLNATDLLGDGAVSYDGSTKTLTISGNITAPDESTSCIKSGIDGLTINVSAPAELSATKYAIDLNGKETTITGSSKLTVTVSSDDPEAMAIVQKQGNIMIDHANISTEGMIYCHTGKMTISDTNISVNSNIWTWVSDLYITNSTVTLSGSGSIYGGGGLLRIDNSTVNATNPNSPNSVFWGWENVMLIDCYYKTPLGGHYDTDLDKLKLLDAEGNPAPTVEIVPGVDPALYIAGKCVTSKNASDILGDGAASYDESTKTLTISGDITAPDEETPCIKSGVEGLTIQVSAPAKLTAKDEVIYLQGGNTTITGSSELKVSTLSNDGSATAILNESSNLTITNANLLVGGKICCSDPDGNLDIINSTLACEGDITGEGALNISKSTVSATSSESEEPVVAGWKSLTLTGCSLLTPEGGRYNTENQMLVDADDNFVSMFLVTNGDISADGKLDNDDVEALKNYIMTGNSDGIDLNNADLNGDDKVNVVDLVLLINKMK